ncbi:MAG: hypothetical protein J0L73_07910 [Verrucomicrobia bacterium]|nr:hypothetical protein [Verrucomicrobiota bacterium]
MTLSEILPSALLLPAADKLRLIRFLAVDIDNEDSVEPLEHGRTYALQSPQFEDGAAQALLGVLEANQH